MRELQKPRKRVVADEARERERTALLEGYLQGVSGSKETRWVLAAVHGKKVGYVGTRR